MLYEEIVAIYIIHSETENQTIYYTSGNLQCTRNDRNTMHPQS